MDVAENSHARESSTSHVVSPERTPLPIHSPVVPEVQSSSASPDSPPLKKDEEANLVHLQASSIISSMRSATDVKVWTSLPGIELMPKT